MWKSLDPAPGRVISMVWTENLLIQLQYLGPFIRLVVKFCWLPKIIFEALCGFYSYLKLKGELALADESYAGGNSYFYAHYYLFYLVLAGSNEPFRVTSSTSSGKYRYSVSGGTALTTVSGFFRFFSFLCPSVCAIHSMYLCACLQLILSF